jgi:hypothetical protein
MLNILWRWAKSLFTPMTIPSATIPKWTPFQLACRLHCLRQGTLNVGNTQQNIANLYNLAVANANGSQSWAKWRVGRVAGTNPATMLRIWVPNVPGYVAPAGAPNAR